MKRIKKLIFGSILACVSAVSLAADQTTERLAHLLGEQTYFSAQFEQVTRTNDNHKVATSQGHVTVARPNKFRWETLAPFPQTIISDGQYIWLYDPDLEQVTRKPFAFAGQNGAAYILNGDITALTRTYDLSLLIDNKTEQLFQLLPRSDEGNFQSIRLFFVDGMMSELRLVDLLGQTTTVIFRQVDVKTHLSNDLFQFTVPEGIDLIISDEP